MTFAKAFQTGQIVGSLALQIATLRLSNAALRSTVMSYRNGEKSPEATKALAEIVDKARAALNAGHVGGRPETLLEACSRVCSEREQARRDCEDAEAQNERTAKELDNVRRVSNEHTASLDHALSQREGTIGHLKRQLGELVRARKRIATGTSPEELATALELELVKVIRGALGIPTPNITPPLLRGESFNPEHLSRCSFRAEAAPLGAVSDSSPPSALPRSAEHA